MTIRHPTLLVVNDCDAATFQVGEAVSHNLQLLQRVPHPFLEFTNYLYRLTAPV